MPILLAACGGPEPSLTLAEPGLICDEQSGATLHLEGSALEPAIQDALGDEPSLLLPTVRLLRASGLCASDTVAPRAVEVDPSRVAWTAPDAVDIRVDGALGLDPGVWDVVVTTRTGHEARLDGALAVAGPPELLSATPSRVCHEADTVELLVEGSGFLLLDGASPVVTLGAAEASVRGGEGCEDLAGPVAGQRCDRLRIEVDPGSLPLGWTQLALTNPSPAPCVAELPLSLEILLPPDIDRVEPSVVCSSGGVVRVEGGPFVEGTTATIGDLPIATVTLVDSSHLELTIPDGSPVGSGALTLFDPSGCVTTLEDAFAVVSPPQAFHVDPPVAPVGSALQATARLADVNAAISDAWLVEQDSGETRTVDWSWSEQTPDLLTFQLPADLDAGTWLLGLEQEEGCPGVLSSGIELTEGASVALAEVSPTHAWTFDHTAVEITARDPIPAGQEGFSDVPEVYLLGPDTDRAAARLLGVRYHDPLRLTAVVPPELTPGSYDLLVVNPDGDYGVLEAAIEVTWDAPPTIDSVSPAAIEKASEELLVLHGSNFRDPVVRLICLESGATSELDAVVESSSYGSIQASVSTRGYNQALCVVQVINDDGTNASWSALSITNPAQNLFPFQLGTPMVEARRAPAAAAGRTNSMDRFVYAIGGDSGTAVEAKSSAEVAPVDPYGELGDWAALPLELPFPLTLAASTTVGRFVYLIGGDDGGGAVDTVLRAVVLDPLEVPWLDSVSLDSVDEGLGAGRWTYRVSALFDGSHAANPGGESLAGEPVHVTLPATDDAWAPTLCWTPVDDAAGYRIYRTAEADGPSCEVSWLADTGATSCYQDLGDTVDGGTTPLPEGSLGTWSTVATLTTPRSAPCVALAQDPALDPEIFHLYVAGGQDAGGALLDSVEVVDVTVVSAREHGVGTPWLSEQHLSEPRWQCAGYTVDDSLHSVVQDETWVFFAGGMAEHNATGTVDRGRVGEDGALEAWDTTRGLSPARAGFGHASASDFLYALGGQQGGPSTSGSSAQIEDDGGLELHNWNSLGSTLHLARWLPGSAQESAIIFVLGGQTDSADASTSTEFTNY